MKQDEIKIKRLLQKCEDWLSNKIQNGTGTNKWWRLDQYIATLDSRISQLDIPESGADNDVLQSFKQSLQVLKQVVQREKEDDLRRQQLPDKLLQRQHSVTVSNTSKQLLHRVANRKECDLRNELFGRSISQVSTTSGGLSPGESSRPSLRQRDVLAEDIEAVLETHQHMQDKLAEDMIAMAKSLKSNALVAREVIRGDNKMLTTTSELAEQNIDQLSEETKRLKKHSANSCSCGIWIMLLFVFIVFFVMILFIRIAPK
ncbi:vesicle transport protein USE1-like [Dysidea avara]|uniref:vesicle transport protein USE1-like n=1 Tax=Dysidea avara TaxID=196820 RepID=UPI003331F9ED